MEFDEEHEDQDEEMEEISVETPGFESLVSARSSIGNANGEGTSATRKAIICTRYRECLKNHAVNVGGHAVDGCGEFIAGGEDGTLDGLKCAACNCHRNFHRKETDADQRFQHYHHYQKQYHHPQLSPFYRGPLQPSGYLHLASATQPRPLALPSPSAGGAFSRNDEDASNPRSGGGNGRGWKKRVRSKFSQEQKEKMLAFAVRIGWRIQKHDEGAVDQFCEETCVKRQVFKVWMHNNKNTLGVFSSISPVSAGEELGGDSFEGGGR